MAAAAGLLAARIHTVRHAPAPTCAIPHAASLPRPPPPPAAASTSSVLLPRLPPPLLPSASASAPGSVAMAPEFSVPCRWHRTVRDSECPSGFTIVLASLKMYIMIPSQYVSDLRAALQTGQLGHIDAHDWTYEAPPAKWSKEHMWMASTPFKSLSPRRLHGMLDRLGVPCVAVRRPSPLLPLLLQCPGTP